MKRKSKDRLELEPAWWVGSWGGTVPGLRLRVFRPLYINRGSGLIRWLLALGSPFQTEQENAEILFWWVVLGTPAVLHVQIQWSVSICMYGYTVIRLYGYMVRWLYGTVHGAVGPSVYISLHYHPMSVYVTISSLLKCFRF